MLKLTKKADYGLMAMKHLAEHAEQGACSAKDVADAYHIPQEALAKILQRLVKAGLLHSQHGTNGGYTLARDPGMISAFEVIRAIDGPLFITSCVTVRGRMRSERSLQYPGAFAAGQPRNRRAASGHHYPGDERRDRVPRRQAPRDKTRSDKTKSSNGIRNHWISRF